MDQSTRSKHSNLKNRAKFAVSKSVSSSRDKFKTLDSKKKGILGNNNNNLKDGDYKRRNNSVKRGEGDENRGRGLESNRNGINGNKFGFKTRKWGAQDAGGDRRRKSDYIVNNKNASNFEDGNYKRRNDSVKRIEGDEIRGRGFKSSHSGLKGAGFNGNKFSLKTRKFENRGSRDAGGDRRKKSDNGENKNGFVKRVGDVKYEDGKRLGSFPEERKFGVKKFKKKENVADDSVAMFDRPRRKRRLIRVEYP
ncbi:uncharacterized protein LOC143584137, partial [Bidens hawaiensis]|uniref:uncharacterized protein LOC143584137 n=1 Tax=Bidens hawaiensis TaxID=980011 RepID=UPI00404A25A5